MKKIHNFMKTAHDYLLFVGKWAFIIVLWLMFIAFFTNSESDYDAQHSARRFVEMYE